jgi:hypothetical protein
MFRTKRGTLVAAAMTLVGVIVSHTPPAGASSPPFVDSKATGLITLCGSNGQRITSGSTLDAPFIGKAISSSPAPSGFAKGTATLYAFQPIQYVQPGDWTGSQLTVGSTYANPSHPVVVGSDGDEPLISFVSGHPLHWNGLLQLRLYFAGGTNGDYRATYPAAILKVKGTRWTAVEEGSLPCGIAQGSPPAAFNAIAPSVVAAVGSKSGAKGSAATANDSRGTSRGTGGSTRGSGSGTGTGSSRSGAGGSGSGSGSAAAVAGTGSGGGLSVGAEAGIAIAALLGAGLGGTLYYRRRRRGAAAPGEQTAS